MEGVALPAAAEATRKRTRQPGEALLRPARSGTSRSVSVTSPAGMHPRRGAVASGQPAPPPRGAWQSAAAPNPRMGAARSLFGDPRANARGHDRAGGTGGWDTAVSSRGGPSWRF